MQVFSCEVWETFKNTYFEEHLRRTASENVFMKLGKIRTSVLQFMIGVS